MTRALIVGGAIFFWLLGTFAGGCMVYTIMDLSGYHRPTKGFVTCIAFGMLLFIGVFAIALVEWEKEGSA